MTINIDIVLFDKLYYERRLPINEIAEELSVCRASIYNFIKKNNLTNRNVHYSTIGSEILTEELLEKTYVKENKSISEISRETNLPQTSIYDKIKEYNITSKPVGRAKIFPFTKRELYNKYWTENKSTTKIAEELGFSQPTIYKYLINFKIPIRSARPRHDTSHISKGELYELYFIDEKTTHEIAVKFGVSKSSIHNLFKKYNIRTRTISENQKGKTGPLAKAWKGGLTRHLYCPKFNDQLKEEIREEFGRFCFMCGKSEKQFNRKLHIHHVDYNKSQGCGQRWVLIPLCGSCHIRTNANRWYYFNLFINYWVRDTEICLNFPGFPEFYPHYFELM